MAYGGHFDRCLQKVIEYLFKEHIMRYFNNM